MAIDREQSLRGADATRMRSGPRNSDAYPVNQTAMLPVHVADAAYVGDALAVRKFLAGGDVDARCLQRDNGTMLEAAAVGCSKEVVRLLLSRRADVDSTNDQSVSILAGAALQPGNLEVIEMLLRAGADVQRANPNDGATAIVCAAERGDADGVRALLKAGANPDAAKNDGGTPLMAAAHNGRTEVIEALLVEGRASVDKQNDEGATALMAAAQQGHAATVSLLLTTGGADAGLRANGMTALDWARQEGRTAAAAALRRHAVALEVERARAARAEAEREAAARAADAAMAQLLAEEDDEPITPALATTAKAKKGQGGRRKLERVSCPPEVRFGGGDEDACTGNDGGGGGDTGGGVPPVARRLLFGKEARGAVPMSEAVQRFLASAKMVDEDKRAAAALLARRRRQFTARNSV